MSALYRAASLRPSSGLRHTPASARSGRYPVAAAVAAVVEALEGRRLLAAELQGTVIGTPGSHNDAGSTRDKAFDDNLATFFDAPTAAGGWVGLDLGGVKAITAVKYAPRNDWSSRMVGGVFQGSNVADFSSSVSNLFTISSAPTDGQLTQQAVTGVFRYVRYQAPADSFGNIAEVEFHGDDVAPKTVSHSFEYLAAPHRLVVKFDQNVSASLSASDLYLEREGADSRVDPSDFALSFNVATNTATFTYDGILPRGNYVSVIHAGDVTNSAAQPMTSNATFQFFFVPGDGSRDRFSNAADAAIVSTYLGQDGDFAQGDYDYSGIVDANDLALVTNDLLANPRLDVGALTVYPASGGRKLMWNDTGPLETGFRIQRSTDGKSFATLGTTGPNEVEFFDSSAAFGTTYWYRLRAVLANEPTQASGSYSAPVKSMQADTTPAAPGTLSFTAPWQNGVTISWTDISTTESGYQIWGRRTGLPVTESFTLLKTTAANVASSSVDTLLANSTYEIRVRAVSGIGVSEFATGTTATTAGPLMVLPGGTRVIADALPNRFIVQFDRAVYGTLTADDIVITNLNGGAVLERSGYSIEFVDGAYAIVINQSSGTPPTVGTPPAPLSANPWPDGNYEITIREGLVHDGATPPAYFGVNGVVSEIVGRGHVWSGDLNGDRIVDFTDFVTVTQNYGKHGLTYAQGNVDLDPQGSVGFDDLTRIAQKYGLELRPAPDSAGELQVQPLPFELDIARASAQLDWIAPELPDLAGYDIFASVNGVDFSLVGSAGATDTSKTLTGLREGKRYHFRIRAYRETTSGKEYSYTSNKPVDVTALPWASDVHITRKKSSSVVINWTDNSTDELSFRIDRTNADGTDLQSFSVPADSTSFEDTTILATPEIDGYTYVVVALGQDQDACPSAPASIQINMPWPTALDATKLGTDRVVLTWDYRQSDLWTPEFIIERRLESQSTFTQIGVASNTARTFEDTEVVSGLRFYRIRARQDLGDTAYAYSAYSKVINIEPVHVIAPGIAGDAQVDEGDEYTLNLGISYGKVNHVAQWFIDWGDGSDPDGTGGVGEIVDGAVAELRHVFADGLANHVITASAVILGETLDAAPLAVQVNNVAPTISLIGGSELTAGQPYELEVRVTDPGVDLGTAVGGGADTPFTWTVNWGDGSSIDTFSSTSLTATHVFAAGVTSANVVATVIDADDGTFTSDPLHVDIAGAAENDFDFEYLSESALRLLWTPRSTGISGYVIQYSDDEAFSINTQSLSADSTDSSIDVTSLVSSKSYFFRLGVVRGSTTEFGGQKLFVVMPDGLPGVPANSTAAGISDSEVKLTWEPFVVEGGTVPPTRVVRVERSDDQLEWSHVGTAESGSSYTDSGLSEGRQYWYRLRYTNGVTHSSATTALMARTRPAAPAAFAANTISSTSIKLTWSDRSQGETGYRIEMRAPGSSTFSTLHTTAANAQNYAVTGLAADSDYSFRLIAINASGDSRAATVDGLTDSGTASLNAPEGLLADKSTLPIAVTITWDAVANASAYRLERRVGTYGTWAVVPGTHTSRLYADTDVSPNQTLYYRVAAIDSSAMVGLSSEEVIATTSLVAPDQLTAETLSGGDIRLSWKDRSPNETAFRVYRIDGTTAHLLQEVAGLDENDLNASTNDVSTIIGSLTPGQQYHFEVVAATDDLESSPSNQVQTTPVRRSVTISGPELLDESDPYTLSLSSTGLPSSLQWTIDWGDGTVSTTVGASVIETHYYLGIPPDGDRRFVIQARASDGVNTYLASGRSVTVESTGLAARSPTASQNKTIRARRAILEAFSDVYNTIKYEPYAGLKKGAAGTADTKRGNDWDQAALLQTKIAAISSEVDSFIEFSVIEMDNAKVQNWLGVTDRASAINVLYRAGILAHFDDDRWQMPYEFDSDDVATSGGTIQIWRANLRVQGLGIDWTLDPSLKYRDLQNFGFQLPIDNTSTESVDESEGTTWYQSEYVKDVTRQSPLEWYESRVDNFLRKPGSAFKGSLADFAYDGPILQKNFALAAVAGSSYTHVPASTEYSYELAPERVTNAAAVDVDGVRDMRHRVVIQIEEESDVILEHTLATATDISEGVWVTYDSSGNVALKIGEDVTPYEQAPDQVDIRLRTFEPGNPDAIHDVLRSRPRGEPIALMINAGQAGKDSLMAAQKAVNEAARPLVLNKEEEASLTISEAFDHQLKLLELVSRSYASERYSSSIAIGAILRQIPRQPTSVDVGFVTGVSRTGGSAIVHPMKQNPVYYWNPNSISGIRLDLPALNSGMSSIASEHSVERESTAFDLEGSMSSYLESHVIEAALGTDSISTVKGEQWIALHHPDSKLGKLDPVTTGDIPDYIATISNGLSNAAHPTGVTDRDFFNTYIAPFLVARMQRYISSGHQSPQVNIIPEVVSIGTWRGMVWRDVYPISTSTPIPISTAYIVCDGRTAAGGLSTNVLHPNVVARNSEANRPTVAGDPVHLVTGELYHDDQLFSLPTDGSSLNLSLHYDTKFKLDETDVAAGLRTSTGIFDTGLGVGWTHSFSEFLSSEDGKLIWRTGDGDRYDFTKISSNKIVSRYDQPAGIFGRLIRRVETTNTYYEYRDTDGTKRRFDADGRLTQITDRNGNAFSLSYGGSGRRRSWVANKIDFVASGASDATRTITFAVRNEDRNVNGKIDRGESHIDSIDDGTGRTWTVEYAESGTKSYLKSIYLNLQQTSAGEYAVDDQRTTYSYYGVDGAADQRHGLLRTITRTSNGEAIGTQLYDYYANGRVFSTTNANGNTEYFSFDQFVSPSLSKEGVSLATVAAEHTDYNGNTTKTVFDDRGLVEQTINPDRSRVGHTWAAYGTDEATAMATIPFGTIGSQSTHNGTMGLEFNVLDPVSITQLGAFDSGGDGLSRLITVSVYNRSTGALLVSREMPLGSTARLVNGYRYISLDSPLTLPAGTQAMIVASNYGVGEPNGNKNNANFDLVFTESSSLEFVGSKWGEVPPPTGPTPMPGYPDFSPDQYLAGGFQFVEADVQGKFLPRSVTNEVGLTDFYTYDLGGVFNGRPSRTVTGSRAAPTIPGIDASADDGIVTTFKYDPTWGGVTQAVVEGTRTTTNDYDPTNGNLMTSTDPLGQTTSYEYFDSGQIQKVTLPRGNEVTYTYDDWGSLETESRAIRTDGAWDDVVLEYGRQSDGTITQNVRFGSLVVTHENDERGNRLVTTDATGRSTYTKYDVFDRPRESGTGNPADSHTWLTRTTYGSVGGSQPRLVKTTVTAGEAESGDGRYRNDSTEVVEFYDGQNQLVSTVTNGIAIVDSTYDGQGNLTSTADALGRVTTYAYDNRSRLFHTTFADGGYNRVLYDGAGRTVRTASTASTVDSTLSSRPQALAPGYARDAEAVSATFYSPLGFVEMVVDPAGQAERFSHDRFGGLIERKFFTETPGEVPPTPFETTIYVRDTLGREIERRSDHGDAVTTNYNANGAVDIVTAYDVTGIANFWSTKRYPKLHLLAQRADRDIRRVVATRYDSFDRPVAVRNPDGTVAGTEYDGAGRAVAMIDPRAMVSVPGSGSAAIDPFLARYVWDHAASQYKSISIYDEAGRVAFSSLPDTDATLDDDNPVLSNGYYATGALKWSKDARGNLTTYTHEILRQSEGDWMDGSRDSVRRVRDVDEAGEDLVSMSATDVAGQLTLTRTPRGVGQVADTLFDYDERGRKARVETPAAAGQHHAPVTLYHYDRAGNLIEVEDDTAPYGDGTTARLRTYTSYDAMNRPLVVQSFQRDDTAEGETLLERTSTSYLNNLVDTTTDARNTVTRHEYRWNTDGTSGVKNLYGQSVTRTYVKGIGDATEKLLSEQVADPFANVTRDQQFAGPNLGELTYFDYDAMDRVIKRMDPDPDRNGSRYTAPSRCTRTTRPATSRPRWGPRTPPRRRMRTTRRAGGPPSPCPIPTAADHWRRRCHATPMPTLPVPKWTTAATCAPSPTRQTTKSRTTTTISTNSKRKPRPSTSARHPAAPTTTKR